MELHSVVSIMVDNQPASVIKVPGGWIYKIGSSENFTTTFVPFTEKALEDLATQAKTNPPATGLGGAVVR